MKASTLVVKKIIKSFLVSLIIGTIIVLITAALMPKDYMIQRSQEISAPVAIVFPLVADFSRWKEWSPWYESEPSATYVTNGPMGKVGSTFTWHGKIVGRGTMKLTQVKEPNALSIDLAFETPHPMQATAEFMFDTKPSSTLVTWTNHGPLEYPMGRMFGPFITQMIARDFEHGLLKLKERAEKP